MRLKVLAIVVLLVVAGGAVFASIGGFSPATTAATTLLTATASVANVTDEIAATGTVQAAWRYELGFGRAPSVTDGGSTASDSSSQAGDSLAAAVTWPVTDVKVAVGDRVTAGQILATAGTADLEAQIADAIRTAQAAAIQLTVAVDARADASTTEARRQTQTSLYNAQSSDARAKADLAALRALRDHVSLTAPADGIVTDVAISTGASAPGGTAITIISSAMRVVTSVVESDIAAIAVDQAASVVVAALDASVQGRVTSIDPVGSGSDSNGVVAFAVSIELDAPPAGLRPGMSADITIVAASATNVLAIPSRALSGAAGAYTVRVVAADGIASTRAVTVGLVTSTLAEITSGLQAGERVVTGTSSSQDQPTTIGGPGGGAFPGGGVIRDGVGGKP